MKAENPIWHDIVLVGGGHSHALVLRRWAMNPLPGVRLTLISRDVLTPYSGMLPGYVSGHYSFDDIHIDLLRLCAWAGVRFIKAEMTGIDLDAKSVSLLGRPNVSYDVLSLDTGSTPTLEVPGAKQHVTPVKPVHSFIERWDSVLSRTPSSLGVVGAGAGGFELVMAMAHRMANQSVALHWFLRGESPMSDRPAKVGAEALACAVQAGIEVHKRFDVSEVKHGVVRAADGREQGFDELLWCTAASAPAWPAECGLATDNRGFVATQATLQSTSHPDVFATGDIGTQVQTPSAKAGVFAVRQAPVLFYNLRAIVSSKALKTYTPQKDFLSLVSTGKQKAIGSRSGFSFSGTWVWRWKDAIDQKFMNKFLHLPPRNPQSMKAAPVDSATATSKGLSAGLSAKNSLRCHGCGAKVPADILNSVLAEIPIHSDSDVEICSGVSTGDDAAVLAWPSPQLVQSVDQLSAFIDDPYLFGRISALHALSDVYASNAKAHSAQALISIPYAKPAIVHRELLQTMLGITSALNEDNCVLVGGHTAESEVSQVGLVVNAELVVANGPDEKNEESNQDYALLLTQPLGVGILFAGLMQSKARGVDVDLALRYLLQSNRVAAETCQAHGMIHGTDVTGFGLLGHLLRMSEREHLNCKINVNDVPLLDGVSELVELGVQSSLSEANQSALAHIRGALELSHSHKTVLTDPQTAGGLLAVVPKQRAEECMKALRIEGYNEVSRIGDAKYVSDRSEKSAVSVLG